MKHAAFCLLAASALCLCAGCEQEYYAKQILVHNAGGGQLGLMVIGTGEQLLKQGRIDHHRRIAAADGTEIDVWVIKARAPDGAPVRGTALLLHGLTESKAQCFHAAQNLAKMGYDVVLPDLRAHGRSGGEYTTYGAWERRDVKAVMDALVGSGRANPNVYVFGVNLGASTAIQYAADDGRVRGVLALTPYKDARSVARRTMALVAPAMSNDDFEKVLARAGEMADFDPEAASTAAAAAKLRCPLLLVHGLLDLSVPLEDGQAVFDAAPQPKKLIVVTPGPEQVALAFILDSWIAEKIHHIATTGLREGATSRPAKP